MSPWSVFPRRVSLKGQKHRLTLAESHWLLNTGVSQHETTVENKDCWFYLHQQPVIIPLISEKLQSNIRMFKFSFRTQPAGAAMCSGSPPGFKYVFWRLFGFLMLFTRVTWWEECLSDPFLLLRITVCPNAFIRLDLWVLIWTRIIGYLPLLPSNLCNAPTCLRAGTSAAEVMGEHRLGEYATPIKFILNPPLNKQLSDSR